MTRNRKQPNRLVSKHSLQRIQYSWSRFSVRQSTRAGHWTVRSGPHPGWTLDSAIRATLYGGQYLQYYVFDKPNLSLSGGRPRRSAGHTYIAGARTGAEDRPQAGQGPPVNQQDLTADRGTAGPRPNHSAICHCQAAHPAAPGKLGRAHCRDVQ